MVANVMTFDYIYQYKDHLEGGALKKCLVDIFSERASWRARERLSYDLDEANSVIINEDYSGVTADYNWAGGATATHEVINGELSFSALNRWQSISKYIDFIPNKTVHIEFDFKKGDMQLPIFYIREKINGVWEAHGDRDRFFLEDGHFEGDFNLQGDQLRIYFEKGTSTDNGTMSTCYIDNLIITQNSLEIVEENNYYPFGLKHKGYNNAVVSEHNWDYQGKENQEEFGLNWHDFGARNYYASIGRWVSIDPLSEDFYSYSTYNAMMNDPIGYIDPDGRAAEWIPGKDGEVVTYTEDVNGNITVSDNATDDTKQIVAGINESGSETAKKQFKGIADSEGKVNLIVNKTDTGANGKSLNGLHQPHDADGNALNWDSSTQSFDGVADTFVDSKGNKVYTEATITIFESNFNDDSQNKFGVMGKTGVWDNDLTKSNTMTGTFAHEVDHNLNQNTVQAVIDRGKGVENNYSVEPPAYKVQKQVHQEIKDNRKKN